MTTVAIEQIIENSNDTEEIQGVEEKFLHVKQTLEEIFRSQEASIPREGLEELLAIYDFYLHTLIEIEIKDKNDSLKKLEERLESFKVKYKEFIPEEIQDDVEHIQSWIKIDLLLLEVKMCFLLASEEKDEEKQLVIFYIACNNFLEIIENHLSSLTEKGRELGRVMAETIIGYRLFSDYASLQPRGKLTDIAIAIRNAARSILWEIDRFEKQIPKSFSIDWEEEEAFMDMLVEDMEDARKAEYSQEDADTLEKVLKKFFD